MNFILYYFKLNVSIAFFRIPISQHWKWANQYHVNKHHQIYTKFGCISNAILRPHEYPEYEIVDSNHNRSD